MIAKTIFNTEFIVEGDAQFIKGLESYKIISSKLVNLKIDIPEGALFFWPNREGELIKSRDINNVLSQKNLSSASICYPATASMLFFIIYNPDTKYGTVLFSNPDTDGKIALFSLNKGTRSPYLQIEADGIDLNISNYKGNTFEEVVDKFLDEQIVDTILPSRVKLSFYQVQLGLYSPLGKHNIPLSKGFEVCEDVAKLMKNNIGYNNIIHIFAYHGAHDSNYPEYFPSQELGGDLGLKKAIEGIHKERQRCSLYMNARLFSLELLDKYPYLKDSIIEDSNGDRVVESYNERDFYVMDPLSEEWRELLKKRASFLKSLGADIIQLDQVAGRAAIGPIGYKWGYGYRLLIQEIESLDLEVWIQGINEIYPANRFELCFRHPNILVDGTIRGGHPFGVSYPLIARILNNQNFIIPLGSKELLRDINKQNITIDLENMPGELSLYSLTYMKDLIKILREQNLYA